MITLRPHQQTMIDDTRDEMRRHKRVLLQGPTGVGKTVLASFMAGRAAERMHRVFFICHRRELIDQTAQTFDACGIEYGYIAAGYKSDSSQLVNICSIDTLKNRLEKVFPPSLCIWDECHHLGAAGWTAVQDRYPDAYHVGLTATPQRLDGKGLSRHFDRLVLGPSVAWLIERGFLAKYRLFSIPGVDLSGVHTRMGDYVKSEAEEAMDTTRIMGNIVEHWQKHAAGRLTIAFGVTRAHSRNIAQSFLDAGIPAAHLDGDTPKTERRETLQRLAAGEIQIVCNVALFGEGYDLAANSGRDVTVGCVIDASPTRSLGAYLQRCGRALRPQDQPAVILDHAGNALRHGMPCESREWSLRGRDKKRGEQQAPVRQCPMCFGTHYPGPICPYCGHVYEIKERSLDEIDGELAEISRVERVKKRKLEQAQAQTFHELVALGRRRKYRYPEGWALKIIGGRRRR